MKQYFYALLIFFFSAVHANAVTYTWNGGGGDWTVAANWTPARTSPAVSDVIVFNSGGTYTVVGLLNQTINQLLISGNTTVSLQTSSVSTLSISGSAGVNNLSVASGSTLSVGTGTGALTLTYLSTGVAGQLGDISGNLILPVGGSLRCALVGNSTTINVSGSIVINQGGLITSNSVTNVTGSVTMQTPGSISSSILDLKFLAGSFFNIPVPTTGIQLTVPSAVWDVASTVNITSAGQTINGFGQTLGNLIINPLLAGAITMSGTPCTVAGQLTLTAGAFAIGSSNTINLNGTIAASGTGTINTVSSATLKIGGTSGGNYGTLRFTGGVQTVGTFTMNRTGSMPSVDLGSSLNVQTALNLTSGILITASNLLTVTGTAANAVTGGSAASYVRGPLARAFPASMSSNATYTFPVGKSAFQSFDLINPKTSAATQIVQAEVFDANSGGTTQVGLTLNSDRYWSVNKLSGTGTFTSSGQVRITESALAATNSIFNSSTVNGVYSSYNSTVSGSQITSNMGVTMPIGLGYYVIGDSTKNVKPSDNWISQNCTTCPKGCYIDAGTIIPSRNVQTASTLTDTGSYGYVYWSFNASKDSTYYFDLCSSTATSDVSWLRLHDARHTNPVNNYCMDSISTPTLVIQNIENGCAGTGVGLSKLIWTCQTSGTYYLESAVNLKPVSWGLQSNQTVNLNYKTLPSYSYTCSDVFYDKGIDGTNGSANSYNNNEDWIYTYYPTDTITDAISVQFTSFSTSAGDQLCVYDGNSINAPQIGCYAGPSITGAFSSSASDGSLTFHFTSTDSVVSAGWQANVSCVDNVGVRKNETGGEGFRIFPNPAKDQFTVCGLQFTVGANLEIFNVLGESVFQSQLQTINHKLQTAVDISSLERGIYFVQLTNLDSSERWIKKLVKE